MSKRQPLSNVCLPGQSLFVLVACALLLCLGCQRSSVQQAATDAVQQATDAAEQSLKSSPPVKSQDNDGGSDSIVADGAKGETGGSAAKQTDDQPVVELTKPVSLFDGKNLDYWEEIEFGGEGDISIENRILNFEMGDPFTGIASTLEDLPKTNYEVSLEARKTDGVDFFCGLTFPVADSHCTLILGGWGGSDCGLSCIDDKDASSNETNTSIHFKQGQWYKIRVRVQPERISVWLDDKQIINANIKGKRISLRGDTSLCEPLGVASFQTQAQYKNIELRTIKVAEDEKDSDE